MLRIFITALAIITLSLVPCTYGQSISAEDSTVPTLTVRGNAELSATPDQAVVQLGAVAQSKNAKDAQEQVNRTVGAILTAIKAAGISEQNISTAELTLVPVHERINRTDQRGAG